MQAEVAIVGGGPVGVGLAIELGRRGVDCVVVERTPELHRIPKGQNLTQRSGEHFRAWGVAEEIRNASPIPRAFGMGGVCAYGTLLGEYHYDWLRRADVRQFYAADNERLPQYDTERVLRHRLADITNAKLLTGHTATGVRAGDDGVEITVEAANGAESQTIRAAYAVGCDGSRSLVREAAGIEQSIDPHDRRMVLLVFRSAELNRLVERYPGKSYFNVLRPGHDGYWMFFGRVDADETWFFHAPVPVDAEADTFDFAELLHDAVGAEFAVDFDYVGFWDLRIATARTYGSGRLFIAGDAAHSHPPYGGYGVNTGFEDARNLGWKLEATLRGWGGPGLLPSYSAERQPVFVSTAEDFIGRMILEDRQFVRAFDPASDRAAFETEWTRRSVDTKGDVFNFVPNYAGSSIVFGDAGANSSALGFHEIVARAGFHLAPRALAGGRDVYDVLGDGFTLLGIGADPAELEAVRTAAAARGLPLDIVVDDGANGADGWGARLILVRPDHFVAFAGDTLPGDAGALLGRATGAE